MSKIIHGVVRGQTIEVREELGLADGQEVEVSVRALPTPEGRGAGLRRCAGALANEWTPEDDRILAAIHEERKQNTRREVSE